MALLPHAAPPFARRLSSSVDLCVCRRCPQVGQSAWHVLHTALHKSGHQTEATAHSHHSHGVGEAVAEVEGRGGLDAVVPGAALFAVYSRVRVGDFRRCMKEFWFDLTDGVGFLETHFTEHKQPAQARSRHHPSRAPQMA